MDNIGDNKPVSLKAVKTEKIKQINEDFSADMQVLMSHINVIAESKWISYNAYLKQGFNEDQALELCKTMMV